MLSLRKIRRDKEVRAEDLAAATGIELQRLWRIERGDVHATVEEGLALAKNLGATVEALAAAPNAVPPMAV